MFNVAETKHRFNVARQHVETCRVGIPALSLCAGSLKHMFIDNMGPMSPLAVVVVVGTSSSIIFMFMQ